MTHNDLPKTPEEAQQRYEKEIQAWLNHEPDTHLPSVRKLTKNLDREGEEKVWAFVYRLYYKLTGRKLPERMAD